MQIQSMKFKPRLRALVIKDPKEQTAKSRRGARTAELRKESGRADLLLRKF